jgi:hypothetical protein
MSAPLASRQATPAQQVMGSPERPVGSPPTVLGSPRSARSSTKVPQTPDQARGTPKRYVRVQGNSPKRPKYQSKHDRAVSDSSIISENLQAVRVERYTWQMVLDRVQSMKDMAIGLKEAEIQDPNVVNFLEAAASTADIFLRLHAKDNDSTNRIRVLGLWWRRTAGARTQLDVTHGHYNRGGLTLSLEDLEHLLWDAAHDGWLNGAVIEAVLQVITYGRREFVIPDSAWRNWFESGVEPPHLPTERADILGAVHFPNHWGAYYADAQNRVIYYLDSAHTSGRRGQVISFKTMLLTHLRSLIISYLSSTNSPKPSSDSAVVVPDIRNINSSSLILYGFRGLGLRRLWQAGAQNSKGGADLGPSDEPAFHSGQRQIRPWFLHLMFRDGHCSAMSDP